MADDIREFGERLGRHCLARYWLKLQLLASDDQMEAVGFDTFAETWMSIVTTPEGLRAGYWEAS